MADVLPTPPAHDQAAAVDWVAEHLGDLTLEGPEGVPPRGHPGGQVFADDALDAWDATGYAGTRNTVLPVERRGASALSPYIRYGLLPLARVWAHVTDAPAYDARKLRDELLWQEYARHLYARLGPRLGSALRFEPTRAAQRWEEPWPRDMACMDHGREMLEEDGWVVNQARMWMSSQYTVRAGGEWSEGEDRFFTHLLDGSRAANRLGWQWTVGSGTGRPYGFARAQVQKRAPELCKRCELRDRCPIEVYPPSDTGRRLDAPELLRSDPDPERTGGPAAPWSPAGAPEPEAVWLTAESLGDADPALQAHPGLPATFVWDDKLLAHWRLSGKRLVFLAETLGDLATRRELTVLRGDPVEALTGTPVAATFAPVPGWRRRARQLSPAVVHPWPWLARPHGGPMGSFSAWRKKVPAGKVARPT